jgi:hypothetical protein
MIEPKSAIGAALPPHAVASVTIELTAESETQ